MKLIKVSCLNKVRKNPAARCKLLLPAPKGAYLWRSTIGTPQCYFPVGDLDRYPLNHIYGYTSVGDQPTLIAIYSLCFVLFVQYAG